VPDKSLRVTLFFLGNIFANRDRPKTKIRDLKAVLPKSLERSKFPPKRPATNQLALGWKPRFEMSDGNDAPAFPSSALLKKTTRFRSRSAEWPSSRESEEFAHDRNDSDWGSTIDRRVWSGPEH